MRVHEQFEMFNIFCKQQIATLHIAQKQSKKKKTNNNRQSDFLIVIFLRLHLTLRWFESI